MFGKHPGRLGATGGRTPIQRAIAILRRLGSNANVYLPGVGRLNGLQAGNYLDSAGTTLGAVDQPVGLALSATSTANASQATAANRPILRRGALNLLTYSHDLTNGAWAKLSSATTPNANTLLLPATGSLLAQGKTMTATVGSTATVAAILSGTGTVILGLDRVGAGAYEEAKQTVTLTATPTLYAVSMTIANVSQTGFELFLTRSASTTASSVTVDGSALFAGSLTAAQIQALGGIPLTTTAPASTALGPYSWQFDGVNDSLSLGAPLFQMADDHCVVVGGAFSGAASTGAAFSLASTVSANPLIELDWAGGSTRVVWRDDANVSDILTHNINTGVSNVVFSGRKVGNNKVLRVNSSVSTSSSLALGVTTLNSGAIGAKPTAVTGNIMNGTIYPVIAIKGTVTDADLLLLEKLVGSMSGVVI